MEQNAHKIIMLAAIATFGLGFLNSFSSEQRKLHGDFPGPYHVRLFVGAGIVFVGLSALADVQPGIAGPFAALIGTTAFVAQGGDAVSNLLTLAPKGN